MMRSNIILFLIVLGLCISCKAQDMQIVVNDNNSKDDDRIKVLSLSKNDTINLSESKPNFYSLKKDFSKSMLIVYKSKTFKINDIDKEAKSIFIDFEDNADDDCYVVNRVYTDAVQSSGISKLQECSSITNIYIYNRYNPDRANNKPSVKLRPKN